MFGARDVGGRQRGENSCFQPLVVCPNALVWLVGAIEQKYRVSRSGFSSP